MTRNMPEISVIVPVCNVERYLEACLDSLLAQQMRPIEILLIDDGSEDRSGAICDAYAERDARIRVFHTENRGLSAARNLGIDRARGAWLMFVDSDDLVTPDFCSGAYAAALANASDLVFFPFQPVEDGAVENGAGAFTRLRKGRAGLRTHREAVDLILGRIGNYAWNKLYKKELFDGIRYPEGRIFEDMPTTWRLVLRAKRIYCMNRILYFYRQRADSITGQKSAARFRESVLMRFELLDGLAGQGYPAERLRAKMLDQSMYCCIRYGLDPADECSVRAQRMLREARGIPGTFSRKQKILFILFRLDPRLFEMACAAGGKRRKSQW